MFIMQNKESRLIQAARRTLRAEAILVVVILVIVSWSIFGLYKLSAGSDTIFGYSFSKLRQDSASSPTDPSSSLTGLDLREELKINGRNFGSYKIPLNQSYNTAASEANRNQLIKELLAGQAELYSNLSPAERVKIDETRLFKNLPSSVASNLDESNVDLIDTTKHDESDLSVYRPNLRLGDNKRSATNLTPSARQPNDEVDEELSLIRDREPAESKHGDNESYVEAGEMPHQSGSGTPSVQSGTYDSGDYQPEVTEDGSAAYEETEEEPADGGVGSDSQTVHSDGDVIGPEQPSDGEEPSLAEEREQAREGSAEVDDEVDKMTEPSSGVAQQQSIPFDYTNTVKFDDTAQPSAIDVVANETDLRHFFNRTTRQPSTSLNNLFKNSTSSSSVEPSKIKQQHHANTREDSKISNKQQANKLSEHVIQKPTKHNKVRKGETEVEKNNQLKRHKRSTDVIIQAPYEMDNFFNSMNLDGLIDSAFHDKIQDSSSNQPDSEKLLVQASNVTQQILPQNSNLDGRKRKKNKKKRANAEIRDRNMELIPSESYSEVRRNSKPSLSRRQDTLDYLTNLINSTNLLQKHKQSQLPSPTVSYNMSGIEPKVSSSQKYIDFDALLHPSANEKRPISNYKKNNKQEKVNSKKRTALGTSKGGHKQKKLDKEEKKFLKEKRFKGAKKGKKVSKGQGGSGGKKGKKLFKDRGYKKKGFKNVAHKEEWGHKKSYFDEFRDKDFKKKWKKFDDKYNYAQMKKFQAKDEKGAKKLKEHDERYKKNDNGKWKKSFQKHSKEHKESSQKKRKSDDFD